MREWVTYTFFLQGIRGGISQVTHRYAKANNKFLSNYDPEKPSSWIVDLDAVGMYANAMCQPLPTGGFEWLDEIPEDKDYVVSCDIHIPEHLKQKFLITHIRSRED